MERRIECPLATNINDPIYIGGFAGYLADSFPLSRVCLLVCLFVILFHLIFHYFFIIINRGKEIRILKETK